MHMHVYNMWHISCVATLLFSAHDGRFSGAQGDSKSQAISSMCNG
jgi:hypothetical protein